MSFIFKKLNHDQIRYAEPIKSRLAYTGAGLGASREINLRSSQLSLKLSGDLGLLIIGVNTRLARPPLEER